MARRPEGAVGWAHPYFHIQIIKKGGKGPVGAPSAPPNSHWMPIEGRAVLASLSTFFFPLAYQLPFLSSSPLLLSPSPSSWSIRLYKVALHFGGSIQSNVGSPLDSTCLFKNVLNSEYLKMTLIPCNAQSEKLFRPWDSDCGSRKESSPINNPANNLKEERLLVVSSPESSPSSGASSCDDESEISSSGSSLGSASASAYSFSAIHQAYSAHMMSLGHHHQPFLPGWIPSIDPFHQPPPTHFHHHHQPAMEAPSMERFLASLESSPESLHPSRLAALGMGPNEIGELYQLAGFKPLMHQHYPPSASIAAPSHPSSSGKKQRPKRFRCPHCQVAFSNNGQLKGHVRSHTGNYLNSNMEIELNNSIFSFFFFFF